nr:hypothetical protein [Deinococcus sp. RIT780]
MRQTGLAAGITRLVGAGVPVRAWASR